MFEILHGSIINGSYISLFSNGEEFKYDLIHEDNVSMTPGQKFITTSQKIIISNNIDSIKLYLGKNVNIYNKIKILIKRKHTKEIFALKYIEGISTDRITLDNTCINKLISHNLSNDKLQIEIDEICPSDLEFCCDKLPSNMTLTPNSINFCYECTSTTTSTSTTTTTISPSP